MMKEKAIIVGASTIGKELGTLQQFLKKEEALIIAADNGIQTLATCDHKPDFWVGDLDSYEANIMDSWLQGITFEKLPVVKDDTDMAVAVEYAFTHGAKEIALFGAAGGIRPSHTMANIQLAYAYEMKGCHVTIFGDGYQMEVITDTKEYAKESKGHISVFALTDCAKDVFIQGLLYEYEGNLYNHTALGVSNSFVGKDAVISVKEGALLIITEEES